MDLDSFVYGAITGLVIVLLAWWVTGRAPRPRVPSWPSLLMLTAVIALPWVTRALGLGFETGVALQFVAGAVALAWTRLRPQRAARPPSA